MLSETFGSLCIELQIARAYIRLAFVSQRGEGAVQHGLDNAEQSRVLGQLSQLLTETATLSAAVGRAVLTGVTNALDLVDQPAIVLDRLGVVLETNAAVESMFDGEFRIETRRLIVGDKPANAALENLADRLQATQHDAAFPTEPIIVKSCRRPPIIIPVPSHLWRCRSLLLGARALLLLTDLGKGWCRTRLIARTFCSQRG